MGYFIYNGKFYEDTILEEQFSLRKRDFIYGNGIFDSIKIVNGRIINIEHHFKTLNYSLKVFNLDINIRTISKSIIELLKKNKVRNGIIKIAVSNDRIFEFKRVYNNTNYLIYILPLEDSIDYNSGVKTSIYPRIRSSNFEEFCYKTKNFLEFLYLTSEAYKKDLYDVIIFNDKNILCSGIKSNIFIIRDMTIYTPSLKCNIVNGTVRETLLSLIPILGFNLKVGMFDMELILTAEEMFFTNSIDDIIPITKLDDKILSNGKIGNKTRKIYNLYFEWVYK